LGSTATLAKTSRSMRGTCCPLKIEDTVDLPAYRGRASGEREEGRARWGKGENSPEAIPPVRPTTMEDSEVSKVSTETPKQLTEHEM